METFPTLSPSAGIIHPRAEWEWPAITVVMENKLEQSRTITSSRRIREFSAIFTVNATDYQTIMEFWDARKGGVETFNYSHPHLGTAMVKFASEALEYTVVAGGDPAWFRLEIRFRGQFYA